MKRIIYLILVILQLLAVSFSINYSTYAVDDVPLTQAEKDKAMQDAIDASKDPRTEAERDAADQAALKDALKKDASKGNANGSTSTDNILGVPANELRDGDVSMDTIPKVIISIISTLLGIAGTVSIFSLIYHAVQMQINSGITGDSSGVDKAKKGMIGALIGFVIAISAWFLVTQAVSLLGSVT